MMHHSLPFESNRPRIGGHGAMCLSLALAIAGNIPFVETDSLLQPMIRAVFMFFAFTILANTARAKGHGISGTWRYLPSTLLAFLAWCALSVLWSLSSHDTILRVMETSLTFLYLQSFVCVALVFYRTLDEVAGLLASAFLIAVIIGLLINLGLFGSPLHFWLNPDVPERPRFTFGFLHPLATGDILALGILTTVFSSWKNLTKLLVCLAFYVLLHFSDSTGARLAVLGLVPSILLLRGGNIGVISKRVFAACFVLVLTIIIIFSSDMLWVTDIGQQSNRIYTLTGRVQIWNTIFDNGLASTATGYGFDASRYVIGPLVGKAYHAHNQFLNVLVELGLIGFSLYLTILASWVWRLVNYGTLFPAVLCIYTLLLSINNPGMFTKLPIMLAFMISYFTPLFFPRQLRDSIHRSKHFQNAGA
jgi:O-antigen ligase